MTDATKQPDPAEPKPAKKAAGDAYVVLSPIFHDRAMLRPGKPGETPVEVTLTEEQAEPLLKAEAIILSADFKAEQDAAAKAKAKVKK